LRRNPFAQMIFIGIIGCAILIPIALVVPWFPHDASRQAHRIHTLYDVLIIATVPIFVLVETVVLYSVWKFRMRPGEELKDGPPIHGNTRLEIIWTAAPAVLIIGLCTYAFTVLRSNENSKKNEMTINVTERQFAFEFSYRAPGGGLVVSSDLYLAKGQPVLFRIHSLDVIHSFFVPEFSQKIDAVPGIATTIRVTPTRIGNYPAECTELCGAGHSLMRAPVHVVTPAAFHAWLAAQKPGGAPPVGTPPSVAAGVGIPGSPPGSGGSQGIGRARGASSSAAGGTSAAPAGTSAPSASSATSPAAGKAVFTSAAAGCYQCHTLAAAGSVGTVGPNLDARLRSDCANPASKKIRGATIQQCVTTAIEKPYAYLPSGYASGIMPSTFAQSLSPTQIQALVNFLSSVTK
jgi:cytochrome c oxidase subunit II